MDASNIQPRTTLTNIEQQIDTLTRLRSSTAKENIETVKEAVKGAFKELEILKSTHPEMAREFSTLEQELKKYAATTWDQGFKATHEFARNPSEKLNETIGRIKLALGQTTQARLNEYNLTRHEYDLRHHKDFRSAESVRAELLDGHHSVGQFLIRPVNKKDKLYNKPGFYALMQLQAGGTISPTYIELTNDGFRLRNKTYGTLDELAKEIFREASHMRVWSGVKIKYGLKSNIEALEKHENFKKDSNYDLLTELSNDKYKKGDVLIRPYNPDNDHVGFTSDCYTIGVRTDKEMLQMYVQPSDEGFDLYDGTGSKQSFDSLEKLMTRIKSYE